MGTVPQITRRKIGSVVIIDLEGELIGPWALRARDSIETLIANSGTDNVLINLKDLSTIDSLGVRAVIDNFDVNKKGGVVSGKIAVMEMFSHLINLDDIRVFKNEDEVIGFFAKDFVDENLFSPFMEQRRAPRLRTALPLLFWYQDQKGEKVSFSAIVTDLSETGLCAEYLDVDSLANFNRSFEAQELQHLHMDIKLPDTDHIHVDGDVMRTLIAGEQIGIGVKFVNLTANDAEKIITFLQS